MKREMLRINNLNMEYSIAERLINVSLCLFEGECVGFLGLVNSGKNLLADFICGKHDIQQVSFYFNGVRRVNTTELKKRAYRVSSSNYLIEDWTVAEYIYLVEDKLWFGINKKKLTAKTEELFREFELHVNPGQKLKKLTELEKRMVDLLKAYSKNAGILVIEDEFDGCSTQDIGQFKTLLDKVVNKGAACIVNSHSYNISHILSDKFILFKKGCIIKKCKKDYIKNDRHLEDLLIGSLRQEGNTGAGTKKTRRCFNKEKVYSVYGVESESGKELRFDFYGGEVTTILALDMKEKIRIFKLLSGRSADKSLCIVLNRKECDFKDIVDFVKNRIVSIADMGGSSELFCGMSPGNNLLLPSLEKISAIQHIFMERRILKILESEISGSIRPKRENIKNMGANEYTLLLLERWLIYKPKVLILFEPFVHCDLYGVSVVKSYIEKFTDAKTAVIIIKSREEYVKDISHRILSI